MSFRFYSSNIENISLFFFLGIDYSAFRTDVQNVNIDLKSLQFLEDNRKYFYEN